MKLLIFALLAVLIAPLSARAQGAQAPLLDRELFFGDPEYSGAQLSPDGEYLSFIKPHKGTRNVWVKKAGEPFTAARVMTAETKRPVASISGRATASSSSTSRIRAATRTTTSTPSTRPTSRPPARTRRPRATSPTPRARGR